MLTETQLKALLFTVEADHIERTASVDDTDKFCQAICAFANDLSNHRQPGYLLIGVKDNGTLSHLAVTDKLLKDLGGIRSNGNVLPQPLINVAKFSLDGGDVAVVEVHPSDLPPCTLQRSCLHSGRTPQGDCERTRGASPYRATSCNGALI